MHSVTLKPFIDFTDVESRHTPPRQTTHFPIRLNYGRPNKRNCRIVARASERDGGAGAEAESQSQQSSSSSSFFQRSQSYALMKQQMELAAKSENYEEAARLRDSLKSFEEEEPVLRLRALMKEAVANDKFEEAARYRDQIKEIAPHYLLKCSSDATTLSMLEALFSLTTIIFSVPDQPEL
ncbi:polymerase delta-interacting protein 2-like protein, partial [Tanacetum coccineum]